MIQYFGPRKKLFKIHFRNVSAPLPHFSETLIDDGYYDMSKVMQALVEVELRRYRDSRSRSGSGSGSGSTGYEPRVPSRRRLPAEPRPRVPSWLHEFNVKGSSEQGLNGVTEA